MSSPLQTRAAVGYAVGDFGINLYFISAMTWLLFFYTDVLGISATAAAGVLVVARLVDAITDPIMGVIVERTRTRWGRMRPYLLFGAIPLALITVLTFTVPDLDTSGKVVWAYVTYTLFGIFYTVVTIPYSALTASLTDDYAARTRLSTYRIGCAFAGGFLASVITFPFVGLFDDPANGVQRLMMLFGVFATALLWVSFATTREVVAPAAQTRLTLRDSQQAVMANPPLWVVIGMFSCGMLGFTVRQTATAYYFTYNVGEPSLTATYFGTTLAVMLVGIWLVPRLADRWGKAGAMRNGAYLVILGCIAFYFTPPSAVVWVFVWGGVISLGATPVAVLGWAMIPDTVEYAQWKHGVRADGAIYSVASFCQKLAKTVGGAGVAFFLGLAGYVAGQTQTATSLSAIHACMTVLPGLIMALLVGLTYLHRLDQEAHTRIVDELRATQG